MFSARLISNGNAPIKCIHQKNTHIRVFSHAKLFPHQRPQSTQEKDTSAHSRNPLISIDFNYRYQNKSLMSTNIQFELIKCTSDEKLEFILIFVIF